MAKQKQSVNRAGQMKLDVALILGTTHVTLETLLNWQEGSLIEMNKKSGESVDLEVNGTPFAKGEVITVAENFGARILEKV